jgi:hypothetical protein
MTDTDQQVAAAGFEKSVFLHNPIAIGSTAHLLFLDHL